MSLFFTMKTENGFVPSAGRVAKAKSDSIKDCPDIGMNQKRVVNF